MSGSNLVVRRLVAIAAASALLAACGGGDMSSAELASAIPTDVTVRTPLVDDDGWAMPADPAPVDITRPATAHGRTTQ
jgi:ABC-type glycerol-3-phosphate transport system substrate-binding protein